MLEEYDVDQLNPRRNPYTKALKKTKAEALHELYRLCQTIEFTESDDLIEQAETEDEKIFVQVVTDCILQEKQRKIIAEKGLGACEKEK